MYQRIKTELSLRHCSPRYFNRAFLSAFLSAYETNRKNRENGIDDSYTVGHVTLYHAWDEIYKTDFYSKNSSAYCEFLEIFYTETKRS